MPKMNDQKPVSAKLQLCDDCIHFDKTVNLFAHL